MSIIKVVGTGLGGNSDKTLFVGPVIPPEIRSMSKAISDIDKKVFRKILHSVIAGFTFSDKLNSESLLLEENSKRRIHLDFKQLCSAKIDEERLRIIHTGLYTLLSCAFRKPSGALKVDTFKEDLAELNIPADFINDLETVVYGGKRSEIDSSMLASRPSLPKLESFRWRVDTTISTSVLNRVLEPYLLVELTLNNGEISSFEVPLTKFQELRYNVSYVLKEMEALEKKSILRLAD
ncbi:COMM domain-containing protein 5-like [Argonauta hians]